MSLVIAGLPARPGDYHSDGPVKEMGKFGIRVVKDYNPDHYEVKKVHMVSKAPFMESSPFYQHT